MKEFYIDLATSLVDLEQVASSLPFESVQDVAICFYLNHR